MAEVPVRQAADRLGVSVDTIRRRIRRGELTYRRDARGRLLVTVDDADVLPMPMQPAHAQAMPEELPMHARLVEVERQRDQLERQVDALNGHVTALTRQLDEAAQERAEMRRLLAGAMHAPELPAASPPPGLDGLITALQENATVAPQQRAWWRRLLGRV